MSSEPQPSFNIAQKKQKILFISDHPLASSGVAVQARFLIQGLLQTGRYTFRCFGGAMKHPDYRTIVVTDDFIIKPVDGFGNKEILRATLINEQPDAVIIFTDPRQFMWLWEMEDEIHQFCPILYWHVWDNDPYPTFNDVWYRSTDAINCLSWKTYEILAANHPRKSKYIPHAFPKEVFYSLPEEQVKAIRAQNFGLKSDWLIGLWVNRNATRKMPNDVLNAWKEFLDELEYTHGHRKAFMLMHTDPVDNEGPNLYAVVDQLGLRDNVVFSTNKLDFPDMNGLYNCADFVVNISKAEGFGLSLLTALMLGKPIVGLKTGGMTRQLVNHETGFVHGVAIEPAARTMVGSQMVPFIYDDHVNYHDVSKAYMQVYELVKMQPERLQELSVKAKEYAAKEFNYEDVVAAWDQSLVDAVAEFNKNKGHGKFTVETL